MKKMRIKMGNLRSNIADSDRCIVLSLGGFKSHKCKCLAALELLEFNSLNDVFLETGCMAKIIVFA